MRAYFNKAKRSGTASRGERGSMAGEIIPSKPAHAESPPAPSIQEIFRDNKTHGLRPLHTPSTYDIDVVFLHGITGRPDRTFFDARTSIYWPVHLLPGQIPNCRILSFGYDADVAKFVEPIGRNTIEEHASDLVNDLSRARFDDSCTSQGIIFVAHSLGGLIVKKALAISENSADEHLSEIEKHVVGIAFLGTPHRGSDIASFATAIANIVKASGKSVNTALLESLQKESPVLAGLEISFAQWARKNEKRVGVECFCEELEVHGVGMVVKRESARLADRPQMSIHANHVDMARFSGLEDEGYQRVSWVIKRWTKDFCRRTGRPSLREDIENVQSMFLDKLGLQKNDLLQFYQAPYEGILATDMSVEWFIKSREFQIWKDSEPLALLWHHSGPDQGKTVIMSYLWEHLSQYFGYSSDVAAIFLSESNSCDYSLVASLVFQLMKNSERRRAVLKKISTSPDSISGGDMNIFIWELLETMIKKVTTRETVFLIDGVDVLKPDVRSSFLNSLRCLEKQAQMNATFRVLISSKPYSAIQDLLSHYEKIERGKERNEFLESLFFREWNARETRIENAYGGSWLPRHKEYRHWRKNLSSDLLWIEGKPGSGKSTLSKQIFRRINKEHGIYDPEAPPGERYEIRYGNGSSNTLNRTSIFAAFYYSFRGGVTETSHELMLRSIVYQIWSQNESLFPIVRDSYRELKQDCHSDKESMWRYDDLKSVLHSLHQIDFPLSVFIIVDGLDESDNKNRHDLLKFLRHLSATESHCIVKILVASRPETDINANLMGVRYILLQNENSDDIQKAVEEGINKLACLFWGREIGQCQSLTRQESSSDDFSGLKDYIMRSSQGVFLWISLVFKDLERCVHRGAYNINSLQKKHLGGSTGFYRNIVDSLVKRDEENEDKDEEDLVQGLRILNWVTFSKRSISIYELGDVFATPTKLDPMTMRDYDFNKNRPRQLERGIISYCGTLVEVHPSEQIVQLIHQTVKEFLLDPNDLASPYNLNEVCGDKEIATTCYHHLRLAFTAAVLQMDADGAYSQVDILTEHLPNFNLLEYSLPSITEHLERLKNNGDDIRGEFESFFEDLRSRPNSYASLLLSKWVKSLTWLSNSKPISDEKEATRCIQTVFVWASSAGKLQAMEILIALQANLDTCDIHGSLALEKAAGCNQPYSIQLLVNKGANINKHGVGSGNALQAASLQGHDEIVNLLLQARADVNIQCGHLGNALQAASFQGHDAIVQMLLNAGADVNARGGHYNNALYAAAFHGHDKVVDLLLQAGANVDIKGGFYYTPLQAACSQGHYNTVLLLLYRGAYLRLRGGFYGNALSVASLRGRQEVVELLLSKGALLNEAHSGILGSALQAASSQGHDKIVQVLVAAGARINTRCGFYGSPLQAASSQGHNKIAHILLNAGAHVNANEPCGFYGNPLQAAFSQGHGTIVQMLLDVGASSYIQCGFYGKLLETASCHGHNSILNILLKYGAHTNIQGAKFGSALQAASYESSSKVVRLLLDAGADVNFQGGQFGSALQAASYQGSSIVVQLLLDAGADVNFQCGQFGSALQAASYMDSSRVVRLLLGVGADVNLQGGEFGSALRAASYRGSSRVMQLLLDAGADVNAQDGDFGSALQFASYQGNMNTVRLLLDAGADVNFQGGQFGSALRAASSQCHDDIVSLLVQAGADFI